MLSETNKIHIWIFITSMKKILKKNWFINIHKIKIKHGVAMGL